MLTVIDLRLRQAFPKNLNEPFERRSIILLGNFRQLPPVLNVPMFSKNLCHNPNSNNRKASYKHIRKVFKFDII